MNRRGGAMRMCRAVPFLAFLATIVGVCGSTGNAADPGAVDALDAADVTDVAEESGEDTRCLAEVLPALTPPRNVIPYVRLRASGTQPRGFWPFEAEDAIATAEAPPPPCVVDDAFAWKPFADAASVQVFGLPGATVAADGTVRWTATHGGRFTVIVTAARGGATPGWAWAEAGIVCSHPCW